ncbi:lipoyl(octanoyl) transferase LipB [Psychrobacter sp. I-STPA10]|uniref:lipoyl(octanoyl) transferase LipB n=1 Tax=Psychrobacter sp. I-STPA10 TaxID=2585769 RepID=UPI001E312169|nr:lipoyl(octanoyl) transferase LipB [Psychrobacter sp. I-STPA10]
MTHSPCSTLTTKTLTQADYQATYDAMYHQTMTRIAQKKQAEQNSDTAVINPTDRLGDELWIVEHNNVYTLGQAGKEAHILQRTNTPIIRTDRGGQVTWHGKGQLVIYWLFDLNALGWGVRNLVSHAEQAIEDVVNYYVQDNGYIACARKDAPGVYLYTQKADGSADTENMLGKIASLGFKIKHGMSYHGIALNLDCDLTAFSYINPCGYAGMNMCRLADFTDLTHEDMATVTQRLVDNIRARHQGMIALR